MTTIPKASAITVLVICLASCTHSEPKLATHPRSAVEVATAMQGRLVIGRNCSWLIDERHKYPVVWPEGSQAKQSHLGPIVTDPDGRSHRSGDTVIIQGGIVDASQLDNKPFLRMYSNQCGKMLIFAVRFLS